MGNYYLDIETTAMNQRKNLGIYATQGAIKTRGEKHA